MSHLCDPLTLALLGAALSLFSFWGGHRATLWRDIRRDFNTVADVLRPRIDADAKQPSPSRRIDGDAMLRLIAFTPAWRRRAVRRRWQAYQEARNQQRREDDYGQAVYADNEPVRRAAVALLRDCAPR